MRDVLPSPEERRWLLLRSFFSSWRRFLGLFEDYERRVKEFSAKFDTDRARLRLEPDDLATVLDFKALEALRDREVSLLREVSHLLFRTPDTTDRFDHLVSIIYHELSALKEEHYTLREEFVRKESIEYERFYREVNQYYPKRLRHIRNLYSKADRRLREVLGTMSGDRVLLRSLHLFGEDLVRDLYPGGLAELHRCLFPRGGTVEARAAVARSLEESGFRVEALEAWTGCIESATHEGVVPDRGAARNRILRILVEARERVSALESELASPAPARASVEV
jgi:hypothetical protein